MMIGTDDVLGAKWNPDGDHGRRPSTQAPAMRFNNALRAGGGVSLVPGGAGTTSGTPSYRRRWQPRVEQVVVGDMMVTDGDATGIDVARDGDLVISAARAADGGVWVWEPTRGGAPDLDLAWSGGDGMFSTVARRVSSPTTARSGGRPARRLRTKATSCSNRWDVVDLMPNLPATMAHP
jgi:hypothetical protein